MFILIAIFYLSATSNAVNLADGMDGLAAGCVGMVSLVLAILCFVASETMSRTTPVTWASYLLLPAIPQAGELCIFYSAILGAVLGFLWFNCHPAQTFMGDVGSLPLGAAMGYGALVTRNEILLLIIGGVFVIELLSVVFQVGYFKYTGGKRLFRCDEAQNCKYQRDHPYTAGSQSVHTVSQIDGIAGGRKIKNRYQYEHPVGQRQTVLVERHPESDAVGYDGLAVRA